MEAEIFEWHADKAEANERVHGIAFHDAVQAFLDPFAVEWIDDREDYGEERVKCSQCVATPFFMSPIPNALGRFGSSRQGGRRNMSKSTITARIRSDTTVVEVLNDRTERSFPQRGKRPMTEAEVEAAAAADPDSRPMTVEQFRSARRVPRIKTLRRALRLTQEEFAARYHIPIGTLRDWEQGRCEPDQTSRAYLTVIAADPHGVERTLTRKATPRL